MRKQMIALLGGTATVVAVVAMSAAPALAATWTVKNGGTDLVANQSGSSTLKDTSSGDSLTCTGGAGDITIANGTGLSGTDLGQLSGVTFNGCTGPFGISFSVATTGTREENAAAYANPTTTGTITNVD